MTLHVGLYAAGRLACIVDMVQVDSMFLAGTQAGAICECRLAIQSSDAKAWEKLQKNSDASYKTVLVPRGWP